MANSMRQVAAAKAMEAPKKSGGNKTFNTPSSDTAWLASDATKKMGGSARPAPADSRAAGRPFGITRSATPVRGRPPGVMPNKPGSAPVAVAATSVKAPSAKVTGLGKTTEADSALKGKPPEAKPAYIGQNIGGDSWARAGRSAKAKIGR